MTKNNSADGELKRVEVTFPFILIRTKKGLSIIERIGRLGLIKKLGWVLLYVFPIVAAIGFYLILNTVVAFISTAALRDFARGITPLANLLIPGINPYLPIFYGWIALIIAIIVHEGGHGILARSLGIPVKSSGMILLLVFPIGAFVDVDEKELRKAKARDSGRVLAAGPGSNIIAALIALFGLLLILGSMTPIVNGVGVVGIVQDSPAQKAGISLNDIIIRVDGVDVSSTSDFNDALKLYGAGETVDLTFERDGKTLNHILTLPNGPVIVGFWQDFPAKQAGIQLEDIIMNLNGIRVSSSNELDEVLSTMKPGDTITLAIERRETPMNFTMALASHPQNSSLPVLGVLLTDPSESHGIRPVGLADILNGYRDFGSTSPVIYLLLPTLAPYNVPFSDVMVNFYTSSLGYALHPLANLLFWVWFISINLAIFNALPIYPLDGGQAFRVLLQAVGKNRLSERTIKRITGGVTIAMVSLVVLMLAVPYL
ncbi:MAG: site-2 protease family protein [Candidatus Methylarchaceae archaeon HK01B]|nr:site-2 protease family protein [Candidatus Methylarchaceae archaeon HK01B]